MKLENLEVIEIKEVQKGTSKATGKEWQNLTFICKNKEEWNNTFAFEIFGEEKITNFLKFTKVGFVIDVDFNISCNEWKGKYFTALSYWKSFKAEGIETPAQSQASVMPEPTESVDDLPF